MDYQLLISQLLIIIAIITAVVNIITEAVKHAFDIQGSKKINIFVLILSIALTLATFVAYWQVKSLTITWYILLAFIIIGIVVAYAAMFGYDKLISNLISKYKEFKNNTLNS